MANERCWYCDQLGVVDHKHGTGHSCGDCCATHGGLTKDMEVYNWVKDCIAAKNARIAELERQLADESKLRFDTAMELGKVCGELAEAQKAADALRLLAVQYPVAVEQAVNIVKATLNAPRTDCPACMMGQDASKGEGTHLEGTRQHLKEPA